MQLLLKHLQPHLPSLGIALLFILGYTTGLYEQLFHLAPPAAISLTILLITALFWVTETFPLYITSMGVLALSTLWLLPELPAEAAADGEAPFFQAFFGDITLLFMGGFVLSALLNKYGLAQRMANWVIQQTGSQPSRVLFGLILISALLSMWMSNTATAAMMFAIIGPVAISIPATSTFARGIALSIPFACNIGGLGTPIGTPPNAIALEYLSQAGIYLSFAKWMLISFPLLILLLLALWWLLLRLYPPGDFSIKLQENEYDEESFTLQQYFVMGIFGLTILGWLTGGLTGLSTGTVGLLCLLASFGLRLLKTPDFRNISWDILFMLGGGLCLGVGLNRSGLTDAIANAIPMEEGFWVVFGLMLLLASAMTTFMSNTATANLLIPVAISLSGNELLLSIAIAMMCSTSMALPVSTPPNAIAFGSGMLEAKDMFRAGLIITLLALLITLVASIFYIPLFL
jgi:solute carrier family 13 (sodium-dependent dicarboxylate transporter), member 2/3/5